MSGEEELPPHDWLLSLLVPISEAELGRLERGQQVVFRKLSPTDASQVRGSAVFCACCQLPWERMTDYERRGCRGEPDPA